MPNARRSRKEKVLSGTVRGDRMRRVGGVQVLTRLPQPPAGLSESASEAWFRCGRLAIELGTLTRFDVALLELLARTLGSVADLEKLLANEGLIVGAASKAHPACALLERSRAQAHRMLADLGLTPPSRERLSIDPQGHEPSNFFRPDRAERHLT
jgi:P27 family predicted phage terminase small subunit